MEEDTQQEDQPVNDGKVAKFARWVNDNVVGNKWTFIVALVLVLAVDLLIPVQGYQKWNLTTGLMFNTQSSSFELITGIGAVFGVASLHKLHAKQKARDAQHSSELAKLHQKLDHLLSHEEVEHHGQADRQVVQSSDSASAGN